jgi:CheY-like chemotaxis protein
MSTIGEQPKDGIRPRNASILIADDDPDDRLLAAKALEDNGFVGNLRFANDGVELMKYLHSSECRKGAEAGARPHLILLDLNMPRKDGREALRDIKAHRYLHDIIIVALTGSEFLNDAEICRELGANCLMSKPESYTLWVQMMGKVLGLLPDSASKRK